MCIRLVARCLRGLESVVAAEILRLGLGTITEMGHREVHFYTTRPDPAILRLPTADDVFLLAADGPDIGPGRTSLTALSGLAAEIDAPALSRSRRLCGGPAGLGAGVEVSASFLGKRAFNRYDLEDVVGRALGDRLGLDYHSRRTGDRPAPSDSGWRLSLDGRRSRLLLRLADRPLHRRAYRQRTVPGSVHPPLASAMAHVADLRTGHRVLDPCCGAATVLIEAASRQPDAVYQGFDLDPSALGAARSNATRRVTIERADAGALPVPSSSVDRIVCNPPWGGQVSAQGSLTRGLVRLWIELRRVLTPDGSAVILIPDARELATAIRTGFTPTHVQQVRVSGRQSFIVRLSRV
ncbi:methyltransferase domain-containing protein [Nocardia terpenica]|uniref:Ribosomal RNA large subunit methyltransferase K/L-like methyltransferase domain-containing protein n=1 Tax=Nocardia terpenica TaxID=455432 RepID=A0A164KEG7_9NOCA|nr:methyltransferase domain-containing protein [Nocardia terpenica]KZM71316.1 hypothetical protein AWN90_00600 [Nocardia terpenica]NQE90457.1 methyltransferase domain-containing protein [Nocardia terpenica]